MPALKTKPLPFEPRAFTRSELIRLDVYLFESPKLGRRVSVVRPSALALAVEYELDHETVAYVERPRMLAYEGGEIELGFWVTTPKGLEQFVLLKPPPPAAAGPARAFDRKWDAIVTAARQAQVSLKLINEAKLLRRTTENANRLRVLPWLQIAREIPQAERVKGRLLESFKIQPRQAFSQIERGLGEFGAREVRAVACALVQAGHLRLDLSVPLHAHSMLELVVPS